MIDGNLQSKEQKSLEEVMKKIHSERFEEWVINFAHNLLNIWKEKSARALDPCPNRRFSKNGKSTIVIGKGPSINKKNHLKILSESKYQGNILCCDGKLIDALKAGVTPDKFPNFYVTTIDPYSGTKKNYDHQIVDDFGSQIKGIFTTIANPSAVTRARKAGIQIHWLHSLFDYSEGKKSFNQVSALMVRAQNHTDGLPAIQTGGNVGTSSWFISWRILKSSTVALIGINHGWEENDSWRMISSHGQNKIKRKMKKNDSYNKKFFKKIYNPDLDCYCILDPIFQFYSNALKEFIKRSPSWLTTNKTFIGSSSGNSII